MRRLRHFGGQSRPRLALCGIVEVLETRQLLSGDLVFESQPAMGMAGKSNSFETADYYIPGTDAALQSVTIDWGDGSTSPAENVTRFVDDGAARPAGPHMGIMDIPAHPAFVGGRITSDHVYAQPGLYTVVTSATVQQPGQADQSVSTTTTLQVVAANLAAPAGPSSATTAAGYDRDTSLAVFHSNVPTPETTLTATIDWGDGSAPMTGRIVAFNLPLLGLPVHPDFVTNPPQWPGDSLDRGLSVVGAHAYATAGTYTATVVVTDGSGLTARTTSTVTALANPLALSANPSYGGAIEGVPAWLGEVASLQDFSTYGVAVQDLSQYTATIDWGDGSTPTSGQVSSTSDPDLNLPGLYTGQYQIGGNHTFAQAGDYAATVTLTDNAGHAATQAVTIHVDPRIPLVLGPLQLHGMSDGNVAGNSDYLVIAEGSMPGLDKVVGSMSGVLSATIDWGDGTPVDTIDPQATYPFGQLEGGNLLIFGIHTFANPGSYSVHVTVTSIRGDSASVVTSMQVVADPTLGSRNTPGSDPEYVVSASPPTTPATTAPSTAPVVPQSPQSTTTPSQDDEPKAVSVGHKGVTIKHHHGKKVVHSHVHPKGPRSA